MANNEGDAAAAAGAAAAAEQNALANVLRNALSNNRKMVQLPSFNATDPELWFSVAEECFSSAGQTPENEREKFSCVVKALDSRVQLEVRDLLVNVPVTTPYTVLRTELIKRLCTSQEEKTRRLLESKRDGQ